MTAAKNGTIQVPGASLYYETRGTGPLLFMIHGGGGDGDKLELIADDLANRYTVVTYDRRGHSRSMLADPNEYYGVEVHSEDARHLLTALTDKPATIFASSSGAVISLDLCMRHPELVRILIPHEPVLLQLLFGKEHEEAENFLKFLKENHKNEVTKLTSTGSDTENPAQNNDVKTERLLRNSTYFVEKEIPGIENYKLDTDALKQAMHLHSLKILPAGGSESKAFFTYKCSVELANKLDTQFVEFPGHHGGYNTPQHKAFAERLNEILIKESN